MASSNRGANTRPFYLIQSTSNRAFGRLIQGWSTSVGVASIKSIGGSVRGANNLVRILASGLEQNFTSKKGMREIHETVAASMRGAVKSSFEQTVKSPAGQYRAGKGRISGGALKRAIENRSLAVGTADGINFVDADRLSREARHWARLNFGTLGSAVPGRQAKRIKLRFDQITLFSVMFNDTSRPPFSLPKGVFLDREGDKVAHSLNRKAGKGVSASSMDRFYPGSGFGDFAPAGLLTGNRVTRGIVPREFLNAGLERMASDLPVAYENMIDDWLKDSEKRLKLPPKERVNALLPSGQRRF